MYKPPSACSAIVAPSRAKREPNAAEVSSSTSPTSVEVVSGGVTVRFPLFEGGLRAADYGQAKSKYREAEQRLTGN